MKFQTIFGLMMLASSFASGAELTTNDLAQARTQGLNALASLKRRIQPATALGMGFSSTNEAQLAVLGENLRIYNIPRARLLAYVPGQSFNAMLEPEGRVIYPAVVHGIPKSTIIVAQAGGNWRTDRFGDPALIQELSAVRQAIATTNAVLASQTFAVEVSVPNFWFIGYTNTTKNSVVLLVTSKLKLGAVS